MSSDETSDQQSRDLEPSTLTKSTYHEQSPQRTDVIQNYRDRQHDIQMLDIELNANRLRLEYLRFLSTIASSSLMLWQNLRYDDLKRLRKDQKKATSAWLGYAYREAPRSLSVDACAWTRWDTPVTPWTTWEASWKKRPIRLAPLPEISEISARRSWKSRVLGKLGRGRLGRRCRVPAFVSAHRSALPSKVPRSPEARKMPSPSQGGFIEHLEENRRFRNMLRSDARQGFWRGNKSEDAQETGILIKRGRLSSLKDKIKVYVSEREADKDDDLLRQQKRRSIPWRILRRAISPWLNLLQ